MSSSKRTYSDEALIYLESIQKQVYADLGQAPRTVDAVLDALQKDPRRDEKDNAGEFKTYLEKYKPASRYEDPVLGAQLVEIFSSIEDEAKILARENNWNLPEFPLIGTLPTGGPDARTFIVPETGEHIILFNGEVFVFCWLLSNAVSSAFPIKKSTQQGNWISTDPSDITRNLDQHPKIAQGFLRIVFSYLLTGRVSAVSPHLSLKDSSSGALNLARSVEHFIAGHEYGHVLQGHLGNIRQTEGFAGQDLFNEVAWNWVEELEADWWGLTLMLNTLPGDLAMRFRGADFFFSCVSVLRRALALLSTGNEMAPPTLTHPPPEIRRLRLREAIEASFGDNGKGALQLASQHQFVIDNLWDRIKSEIADMHMNGMQAHRIWRHWQEEERELLGFSTR